MISPIQLFSIARCSFEAARRVSILPTGHRSARMHGHSFMAKISREVAPGAKKELEILDSQLGEVIGPLNYDILNSHINVPTDENLARYVRSRVSASFVGIQSTRHQGVDLDANDVAHIWRRFRFEAAHRLPNVQDGHPCGRMHGHGFEIVLHAKESIVHRDMGVDFDRIEEIWRPLGETLDYSCLNDIRGLENPTSELIAKWIWDHIKPEFEELTWVTVYETSTAGCHYDGQQYRIWKQFRFESALRRLLSEKTDRLGRLHGHSYIGHLHLTCELNDLMGWTIDYGDVKNLFRSTYDLLDHHSINEIAGLDDTDVGTILHWIRNRLGDVLPSLDGIDLFETPRRGAFLSWGESNQSALLI